MNCAVEGCPRTAEWTADDGKPYCEAHTRIFLMSEDREEFAESWAIDVRRERERECA